VRREFGVLASLALSGCEPATVLHCSATTNAHRVSAASITLQNRSSKAIVKTRAPLVPG
jgi:hypothetical protein